MFSRLPGVGIFTAIVQRSGGACSVCVMLGEQAGSVVGVVLPLNAHQGVAAELPFARSPIAKQLDEVFRSHTRRIEQIGHFDVAFHMQLFRSALGTAQLL